MKLFFGKRSFFSFVLGIVLLANFLILPFGGTRRTLEAKALVKQDTHGAWMHVDTFMNEPDAVVEQYADALVKSNLRRLFILGKKIDGSVNFHSPRAVKRSFSSDPMKRLVKILKSRDLQIFFYFPVNTDPAWISAHPHDVAWHYGNRQTRAPLQDPEKRLVNLTSTSYREYILHLVEDAFQSYDIDGIQLDYIRYRNGHWGFSEQELNMAQKKGINIKKIQDYCYETFVQPADWSTLLKKYDEKDPEVLSWVKLREDIIFQFAQHISQEVRKRGKIFSVTLVHAGALGSAYGAIHFSQSYPRLSEISDIAAPMAYHGNQEKIEDFVASIIDGAMRQIHPSCQMMMGLQAYETSTLRMRRAIQTAQKRGVSFILFRVGTFSMAHLDIQAPSEHTASLTAEIFHTIPQQVIVGVEVRGLGGWMQLKDQYKNDSSQFFEDGFKVWGKTIASSLGLYPVSFQMQILPNDLSSFFDPFVVLADQKKEIPTLTTSSSRARHLIIHLPSRQLKLDENTRQVIRMETLKETTYLHAEDFVHWGLEVVLSPHDQKVELHQGLRRLKIDYQKGTMSIKYFPSDQDIVYPHHVHLASYPWVPMRICFELMGYYVFYQAERKEIHLLKTTRNSEQLSSSRISSWGDFCWFWNKGEAGLLAIDDFLSVDFYQLTDALRKRGQRIVVQVNPEWKHAQHGASIFWMMQEMIPRWYQPDNLEWLSSASQERSCLP